MKPLPHLPHITWQRLHTGILLGLALALGISSLEFPSYAAPGDHLDSGWQQTLGYFLRQRSQAGVDWIFTYGPLGYFATTVYDSELFWWKFAWELIFKLAFSAAAFVIAFRLRPPILGVVFLLLLVLFLPEDAASLFDPGPGPPEKIATRTDAFHVMLILLLGSLPTVVQRPPLVYLVVAPTLLAILSLVKFTLLVLSLLAVLTITVQTWKFGPRWRAILALAAYLLSFALVWCLVGQTLSNIPAFLRGSLELVAGYNEAMSWPQHPGLKPIAILYLGMILATLGTYGRRLVRSPSDAAVACLILATGFMVWKHTFIRHGLEPVIFFNVALLMPFVLVIALRIQTPGQHSGIRTVCVTLAVLLAVLGQWILFVENENVTENDPRNLLQASYRRLRGTTSQVFTPRTLRAGLEARKVANEKLQHLPGVQTRVGESTIDMISCWPGLLFANGLHYQPRPVFQSYTAYTPYLLEKNAGFFRGNEAPQFVLLKFAPIDSRLPLSEDGPAMLEIFRRYRPVLKEKDYLLLGKDSRPVRSLPGTVVLDQAVTFDDKIDLTRFPGRYLTLSLQIEFSLQGVLQNAVNTLTPILIELKLEGVKSPRLFRLIPGMTRTEFLLSPMLTSTADVVDFYQGDRGNQVQEIRVLAPEPGRVNYKSTIHLTLRAYDQLPLLEKPTSGQQP